MPNVCVTGANRGIGLELCRQLKERGYTVHALCRHSSDELNEITGNVIEGIDVTDTAIVNKLKSLLAVEQLDLLVNAAGVLESVSWPDLNYDAITRQFEVNAVGPLRITQALNGLLQKGSKIAMITSRMGSIADNTSGGTYGYRMSKTALNAASVSLAHDLKSKGIAVGIIHPGWVRTDMTGHSGNIDVEESVRGIIARIEDLNINNSGTFWHQNGEVLPW